MPNDQNSSQGRRPNYHRGRRGGERRATERRLPQSAPEATHREHVDVEQIMRDIRARISSRHGIDLAPQQIQELAARRLEAILEPRHVKPALLEQMRRAAGESIAVPSPTATTDAPFDEASLYESHRGIVRWLRRVLNPILKLFFNPTPIAQALSAQTVRNNAAAQREQELYARQAEWNALHYEIIQRLVTEVARTTLEMQSLTLRVEALDGKLDFNERRVRAMESTPMHSRPAPRPAEPATSEAAAQPGAQAPAATAGDSQATGDGARRRRRRRRGRRSGPASADGTMAPGSDPRGESDGDEGDSDSGDNADSGEFGATSDGEGGALEPAHHFSLLQPAERYPSADSAAPVEPSSFAEPVPADAATHDPVTPAETTRPNEPES